MRSGVRTGGGGGLRGSNPPIDDWKKLKIALVGPISVFFIQGLCFSVLYQIAYIISRNFYCDAIIPVVKLFWCVALEPCPTVIVGHGLNRWLA